MKENELLLLDTHIWLWILESNPRVTPSLQKQIAKYSKNNALRLSAISIFEVAMLWRKKRFSIAGNIGDWIQSALEIPGLLVSPVGSRIALESQLIDNGFHAEPADRFIVATAKIEHCRLATSDGLILSYLKRCDFKFLQV